MKIEKTKLIESVNGFTERDSFSKAILNTDMNSLLKYKIQKRRMMDVTRTSDEISDIQNQINSLRDDLSEIKNLLQLIKNKN